jgi:hypothetical protein
MSVLVNLMQKSNKVISQFGQDGIHEEIFKLIGTTNKYFVEFGCSGLSRGNDNSSFLRTRLGFDGLLMNSYDTSSDNHKLRDYYVYTEFVKPSNINTLFEKYSVPDEFDFLSISISGQDFHVWNAIESVKYRPRVVCIESNHRILPSKDLVSQYNENYIWDGTPIYGSSAYALQKLGNVKGYTLVAISGYYLIFIRSDICNKLDLKFINENNCIKLWFENIELGYNTVVSRELQDSFDTSAELTSLSRYIA